MTAAEPFVVFSLDDQVYGIPLGVVERVVRMVEIILLPACPDFVPGVINVQGEIMPVVDLRRRFGLAVRPMDIADPLIVTRIAGHGYALVVDSVADVRNCAVEELSSVDAILPELPFLAGVAKLPDGLILIGDPCKLLTPIERDAVRLAMTEAAQ